MKIAVLTTSYPRDEHDVAGLFIADAGNARILSVKLGYHAEEKIALKEVPDQGRK